ncbi:MAG TPA: hypothetical protein VD886_11440 [Herpetosiphonaceae bacterium]|nr:hypothetical protein [Herpetosiphonaceae bacterium]
MTPPASRTIPALPCAALDETLAFWQSLGFAVTYQQRAPNPYAVLAYADYELHFFGLKQLAPEANFSTCLVIVAEVEGLHRTFAERLRAALGRVPGTGFPRISRMRPGQTRFTLTDVAGNSVIFIKHGDEDEQAAQAYTKPDQTPLTRALRTAERLRDFKNDDAAAAKVLDNALARHAHAPPPEQALALAARIELAVALDDRPGATTLRARLAALALSDAERAAVNAQLASLD